MKKRLTSVQIISHVHAMATSVAEKQSTNTTDVFYATIGRRLLINWRSMFESHQSQKVNSGVRKGIWTCIASSSSFNNSDCHVATKSDKIIVIIITYQQQNVWQTRYVFQTISISTSSMLFIIQVKCSLGSGLHRSHIFRFHISFKARFPRVHFSMLQ